MDHPYEHTQDFLNDDSFVQWVLFGKDKALWQGYLLENPSKRLMVEEARRLLLDVRAAEGQDTPLLNQHSVWNKIRSDLRLPTEPQKTPTRSRLAYPAWAAGVILVLGISWLLWESQKSGRVSYQELTAVIKEKNELIEKVSGSNDSVRVVLEDGSVVTLSPHSKLSYPTHFEGSRRRVILTGEAFFDISKDPSRPFYIYAGEVVTKVLGTSFRIQAFDEANQVLVQVKTGRVSVYSQPRLILSDPETDGLVLLPNQQAVYSRAQQNLSRRLVDVPQPVVAPSQGTPLRYDEVPASRILRDLEAQYGITILFNDDVLDRCVLTTTLGDEPLHEKLDLICQTIGATYKEVDAQLIVESKGCR
ncbi:FecR family protein [Salmonirosea aquatica]|uniref:DUF4974 domain-containing protein n=1 Tax=Salmonirosea aquatica TaxID=2654236 RepID=A0A7C9BKS7_9BACT|nr:DUF4974 domain-containing protein [Cytophagaceae bacterium SJW1-29]